MTAWRKSSFCNGADACVEARYVKASASSFAGECVEAHLCQDVPEVWVRDSKDPGGLVLRVPVADWWSLLVAVKAGQLGSYGGLVQFQRVAHDTWNMWLTSDDTAKLQFTEGEAEAFVEGVHNREFDFSALSMAPGPYANASGRTSTGSVAGEDAAPVSV